MNEQINTTVETPRVDEAQDAAVSAVRLPVGGVDSNVKPVEAKAENKEASDVVTSL